MGATSAMRNPHEALDIRRFEVILESMSTCNTPSVVSVEIFHDLVADEFIVTDLTGEHDPVAVDDEAEALDEAEAMQAVVGGEISRV